jgi:predicted signal transduction protein with EAL and GGDEF domain
VVRAFVQFGRFGCLAATRLAVDRALCRMANIFRFFCRSIDTVAWYGGDEFAIILPERGAKDADAVGRRISDCLSNYRENPLLSVRVGTAVYPEDGTTIEALFQAADRALYKMKRLGKHANRLTCQAPLTQEVTGSKHCRDCLFADLIDDGRLYPAFLNVQDIIRRITLRVPSTNPIPAEGRSAEY